MYKQMTNTCANILENNFSKSGMPLQLHGLKQAVGIHQITETSRDRVNGINITKKTKIPNVYFDGVLLSTVGIFLCFCYFTVINIIHYTPACFSAYYIDPYFS